MERPLPEEPLPLNIAARCLRVPKGWLLLEIQAMRIPALIAGRSVLVHVPTVAALLAERAKGAPMTSSPTLLAAAPDLLAACKMALADRFGGDDECVDGDPIITALRAAIAKAGGLGLLVDVTA